MSEGRTGTRVMRSARRLSPSALAQGVADRRGDRRGHRDARRLAHPLGAERRLRVGFLDEGRHHRRHVEHRRQQVVGEAGVADPPVDLDDLLHQRQPQALGDAALDLAGHRQRVDRPPDVLAGGHLHHLHQPEVGVDVDDGAVGDERERDVAVALPVVVERLGGAVAELDLPLEHGVSQRVAERHAQRPHRVDHLVTLHDQAQRVETVRRADQREQVLAHRPARRVDRPAAHPGLTRRRRRTGRPDGRVDRGRARRRRRRGSSGRSGRRW